MEGEELMPLDERDAWGYLAVGSRARRAFCDLGIITIGDLIEFDAGTLLRCNGFGRGTLEEVKNALRESGLELHKVPHWQRHPRRSLLHGDADFITGDYT